MVPAAVATVPQLDPLTLLAASVRPQLTLPGSQSPSLHPGTWPVATSSRVGVCLALASFCPSGSGMRGTPRLTRAWWLHLMP